VNGMSREANDLLHAGRQAFSPTEADRARVMAALAGAASLSVGAVLAAGAQRSLSGIFNFVPAARALALTVPLAAAGAYGWQVLESRPTKVEAAPQTKPAAVAVARPIERPPEPEETRAAESSSEPSEPLATTERSAPALGQPSRRGNEIRQEVALLSKAQAALSAGRAKDALEALTEHALRFPRGALTEERTATRARTLCALGLRQEAETELMRLEKLNPGSAYLTRARESCGPR
jgi:hypothetical protein